jgi:hypothetical protein
MPVLLAHGALGAFDELIFAAVGIAFLVMMGVSWLRSRNLPPEDEEDAVPIQAVDSTSQNTDRFRLQ